MYGQNAILIDAECQLVRRVKWNDPSCLQEVVGLVSTSQKKPEILLIAWVMPPIERQVTLIVDGNPGELDFGFEIPGRKPSCRYPGNGFLPVIDSDPALIETALRREVQFWRRNHGDRTANYQ